MIWKDPDARFIAALLFLYVALVSGALAVMSG